MIKNYYSLAKPGIIYGNAITLAAGFALASKGHFNFSLLFTAFIGISFVIASGCVFNNLLDRDIDAKMERTKDRVLVRRLVSTRNAVIYGTCLGLIGFSTLVLCTNLLAAGIALAGWFFYVVMYTAWKRRSVHGTIVGSISGATPPLVGYCAVSNNFDGGAVILFSILVLWQMPHFYAIAIYRLNDYIAASIPVLPVKKGIRATKIQTCLYIVAFTVAASMLTVFGYAGYAYLTVAILLGLSWLGLAIKGFRILDDKLWARKMFVVSLVVLMVLCATIIADVVVLTA